MKRATLLAVLLVAVVTTTGAASADRVDPRFETHVPEPTLRPGQTTQLTVQLLNDAKDVNDTAKTAANAKVRLESDGTPIEVFSGVRLVGDVPDGRAIPLTFAVGAPADVAAGTYELNLKVRYEWHGKVKTRNVPVEVTVDERPRFRVVSASSNASVGDSGTLELTMRNVGSQVANDTTVSLQSGSAAVGFGGTAAASRYVGEWQTGETRTVEFDVSVAPGSERRSYPVTARVEYDADGSPGASRPLSFGVTPLDAQSFSLANASSTLRVGEEGDVSATVTNDGPRAVEDAVVALQASGMNVHPLEVEYAVGDLAAGESTTVRFPVEVSTGASDGPRQFRFTVQYQNAEDEPRKSDPLAATVAVAPQRDQFTVEPRDVSVTAGGNAVVTFAVTNNGDRAVSNVNAKAFADDPLSLSDSDAFLGSLEPGATATVKLSVAAGGAALEKTYPLSVDFQYDTADGDTLVTDTYQVPVEVREPEGGGGLPATYLGGALVAVVVVLAGGYYWFRMRG